MHFIASGGVGEEQVDAEDGGIGQGGGGQAQGGGCGA